MKPSFLLSLRRYTMGELASVEDIIAERGDVDDDGEDWGEIDPSEVWSEMKKAAGDGDDEEKEEEEEEEEEE